MTLSTQDSGTRAAALPPEVQAEYAAEQAHVDQVYDELARAAQRAGVVESEGLSRGFSDRVMDGQDEGAAVLFQRDALVHHAAQRRHDLEAQHEGLVFGRLDLDATTRSGEAVRQVRHIGRIGVRDEDYEPLVIDWRAPAAASFYRATPVDPQGVIRRRVLRCRDQQVIGIEDDLMVTDPPEGMVVVGDGALMAALTRSRGQQMRDIVATIQAHQDEAIRASSRGVTEITGGPGTGKTVVALHRAAYLLYTDRRRYEADGILVVGPSAAYTAYIERVLPSLGEDTVTLRSQGNLVDQVEATRLDDPAVAAVKGSLRMKQVLSRAARDVVPGAPTRFRAFIGGIAYRLDQPHLDRIRRTVLRTTTRNLAVSALRSALAEAVWASNPTGDKADFLDQWTDHLEVDAFMEAWAPQVDPREPLLWLADAERAAAYCRGILDAEETRLLSSAMAHTLQVGTWTVADVALIDDLISRMSPVQEGPKEERGFYEIEEYDDLSQFGVREVQPQFASASREPVAQLRSHDPRERLLAGAVSKREEYAHVLVDEAQDLSPMQWRALGRRGRYASWTVVGDAAQSSWPDPAESKLAQEQAWGGQEQRTFHMTTNYRNAREIFAYAARLIREVVPDADIPDAVRDTGVEPVERSFGDDLLAVSTDAITDLREEVDGSIAVITPARHAATLASLADERVVVIDPMSTKGLEYDATVVVDPDEIAAESPGGIRVLYVALTRAAHRMTVLRP